MSKFQPVKFKDVDDMLASLPADELELTRLLMQLVQTTLPHATVKLAYNVPFYYGKSRICFIWPGSVPWGTTKPGVAIGFCKGHLIEDESGFLEKGNRKEVTMKTFMNPGEIPVGLLKSLLFQAGEIDRKHLK